MPEPTPVPDPVSAIQSENRASRQALWGALFMLATAVGSGCMAGLVRHVSIDMHPFQIVFFRNFFGLVALMPLVFSYGWQPLKTKHFGWHSLRAALNLSAMLCYFYALGFTPLAKVASLSFVSPLFATLFAIFLLREPIRARRMTALAIGFIGAVIIIRPGSEAMNLGAMLVLISSAIWALALLVIKILSREESAVSIAFYAAILLMPFSLIPALFVWVWPTPEQWAWLVCIGVVGSSMHLTIAQAFKMADATAVLPIDFTKLIWSALVGYIFFAEIPEIWTWIGAIVIFSSSIYIAYRENQDKNSPPSARAPVAPV